MTALFLLVVLNTVFGVWSHKGLRKQIQTTQDDLVLLITGKVRVEGPSEAQDQASLRQRLEVRAEERRLALKPIRL